MTRISDIRRNSDHLNPGVATTDGSSAMMISNRPLTAILIISGDETSVNSTFT